MKRWAAPIGLLAILAFGAGPAWAVDPIVFTSTSADSFMSPSPGDSFNQGTLWLLENTSTGTGHSHNVTAYVTGPDGKALFRSATIAPGASTPIYGTEYLGPGTYSFFCTVHPSMSAVLSVFTGGTPKARPAVTLKVLTSSIDASKIKVQETSASTSGAPIGSILAKLGKTTLTKDARLSVPPGESSTIKLKLSSAGRKKLAGRSSAKIKVIGTPDFGSPVTVKKKLT